MPAVTVTRPTREKLADLAYEAAEYRKAQLEGCCWWEAPCADHQDARAMSAALRLLGLIVRGADSDAEALGAIRAMPLNVLAEVLGATTDKDLRAAITGGNGGAGNE